MLSLALVAVATTPVAAITAGEFEAGRAFLDDGTGWLLQEKERQFYASLDPARRGDFRSEFLRDPVPETPGVNELERAIERRTALWRGEFLSPIDERAQALFLFGRPLERLVADCAETYRSLEIWRWAHGSMVFYEPRGERGHSAWSPGDGKRVLYDDRMLGWLEQWERAGAPGRRFEAQVCSHAPRVDEATGVAGLSRPVGEGAVARLALEAPEDRGGWARAALEGAEVEGDPAGMLEAAQLQVLFPAARGQRIVARFIVALGSPDQLGVATLGVEGEGSALGNDPSIAPPSGAAAGAGRRVWKLAVDGVVERQGKIFDTFRNRFEIKAPPDGVLLADASPVALVVERALRPGDDAVLRLRVRDEVSGAEVRFDQGLRIPVVAVPVVEPPVPPIAIAELEADLGSQALPGVDSIRLVPPADDVMLGLWRAEALVTGEKVRRVAFLVDGVVQLTRASPPWTAELRLPKLPRETSVRVEAFGADGSLVASDDVVLNQPSGQFELRLVEPLRAARLAPGAKTVRARAELVVPDGRRVEKLEFKIGELVLATRRLPPWSADLPINPLAELQYVTAVAVLDDGTRAEDLRFINPPANFEEVDVQFVELYTTVVDRSGRPLLDLAEEDFEVFEDQRRQRLAKFSTIDDLPLTLGLVIDTSGSMMSTLGQAQVAATGFLRNLVGPGDHCFALSFDDRPAVRMPRSDDPEAVALALRDLKANGATALHDAIVHALYYFRGTRGQRALVLLSDGDDTSSVVPFRDALEYARKSGVAIYTIGLGLPLSAFEARNKLQELATATGGRSFFVREANELASTYGEIERELRSQFLLAYVSDAPGGAADFRTVDVRVKRSGLKARTIRGYYP